MTDGICGFRNLSRPDQPECTSPPHPIIEPHTWETPESRHETRVERAIRRDAERKALDALEGELGSEFYAEVSPPLDALAAVLAKHGWVYAPEPRAIRRQVAEECAQAIERLLGDATHCRCEACRVLRICLDRVREIGAKGDSDATRA